MRSPKIFATLLATTMLSSVALAQSPAPAPRADNQATAQKMTHKGEWRASKVIGVNVYNEKNEKIGDINEILVDQSGKVLGYVVGVGGFLGMGEHDVLFGTDKIKFVNEPVRTTSNNDAARPATTGAASNARAARNANEKWYPDHAMVSGTKEQIKALPEFKYSSYN